MIMRRNALVLAMSALLSAPLQSQESSVAQAVRRVNTGTLRLQFKARAGVCGSGQSMSFNAGERSRRHNGEWESE